MPSGWPPGSHQVQQHLRHRCDRSARRRRRQRAARSALPEALIKILRHIHFGAAKHGANAHSLTLQRGRGLKLLKQSVPLRAFACMHQQEADEGIEGRSAAPLSRATCMARAAYYDSIPVCSAVGGRRRRQCKSLQRGLCVSLRHAHHTSAQFLFLLLNGNNGDGACALLPAASRGAVAADVPGGPPACSSPAQATSLDAVLPKGCPVTINLPLGLQETLQCCNRQLPSTVSQVCPHPSSVAVSGVFK